jgi:hypothetical protein
VEPGGANPSSRSPAPASDCQLWTCPPSTSNPSAAQNAKIGLAILNAKPHYSAAEMEAQFAQGRELLARVSSFRPNARGSSTPGAASCGRHSSASLPTSPGAASSRGR